MAGSPKLKVYNPSGEYVASCKYGEDAAMIAGGYGEGATIRYGHSLIVWREGSETEMASESYDTCADTMAERIAMRWAR